METLQPKLRFPGFEGDMNYLYKKHSFEDVFLFSTGKNIKQNEASPEFETLCVRYGELYHMYNEVIKVVINRTNLDKSELIFSEGDEILLPSAGEDPLDIGSASALTVENVAIGRTINILKPLKQNVYSNIYASYYINHKLRPKIATLAKGVSISNVYNSDLKTLDIILPTLQEQTRIANFLSSVDEKLNLLKEKKALLEDYKKGIMQKIFNQEIRFKDDNGEDFEEWEEKGLGEIADFYKGKGLPKNHISDDGEYKCIHYGELFTKYDELIKNIISKTNIYVKPFLSISNDVLMPTSDVTPNGLATASCIKEDDVILGGDVLVIRQKTKILDGLFLAFYIKQYKDKVMKLVSGSTVYHLYGSDMKNLDIKYPRLEEQTKIANFLSAIDEKIDLVSNQIEETQEYKKGLLQQMFI
ncbi:restriction endonuclease subunit S [Flavobacterium taihuense]|uniref:Restriction endonuclease subunit S n=1 Tax=Flavobacterium taihuense TaxID=2857508 RepID=A0ABS6XWG9_9FLAO|nr:restriction endonuclease subunit S [Flavobacterium taihuense]MBW4361025.1 restriction endonuclease subunit S [Flavobacterium taihuense]